MEIDTKPSVVNSVTLRPMLCNLNAHTRADGSALFAQGNRSNGMDVPLHGNAITLELVFFSFCFFYAPHTGDTAMTATIIGPTEVKLHHLQIDKSYVDVLYHSKAGLVTVADKLREKIFKNTCETALLSILYPRSAIILQIFEMENGGGVS